jgi:hypothetical protein
LASYAKQADDEQLLNNANRIKARAIDRVGELADEVPPQGGPSAKGSSWGGGSPTPSRTQVARNAGLSPDQLKTALRVHNVPRDDFERQVESDNPPTITELARQGTKSRPESFDMLQGRDPGDFQALGCDERANSKTKKPAASRPACAKLKALLAKGPLVPS